MHHTIVTDQKLVEVNVDMWCQNLIARDTVPPFEQLKSSLERAIIPTSEEDKSL